MWILSAVTALQGDPWETLVVILKHFLVHIYNQRHKLLVWETQILARDDIYQSGSHCENTPREIF